MKRWFVPKPLSMWSKDEQMDYAFGRSPNEMEVMPVTEHEAVVAELEAEIIGLLALIGGLAKKNDRLKRVVEKLREQRDDAILDSQYEIGYGIDQAAKNNALEIIKRKDAELDAIEKGGT